MSRRGAVLVALLLASVRPSLVGAQSATNVPDVVDPWRASKHDAPQRMLIDLEDPWAEVGHADVLLDPWRNKRTRVGLRGRALEVIDPWRQDSVATPSPPPIPTAAFPLLDPWQARATTPSPAAPRSVPTAAFPVLDTVRPW